MSPNEGEQVQNEGDVADGSRPFPEEDMQVIARGVDVLQAKFSENAALPSEIETVIREHLRTVVTSDTFYKIISGLELYLDTDTVVFLLENLRRSNEPAYIEQVKNQCTEQLWGWLRYLIALYGFDFGKAYSTGTENSHAWDVLNRHTYYDSLTDTWSISLEIVKYNGECLTLEETPRGALTLAQGIIDMLLSVPAEVAPGLIESAYLNEIHNQFLQLKTVYAPEQLTESAEKSDR